MNVCKTYLLAFAVFLGIAMTFVALPVFAQDTTRTASDANVARPPEQEEQVLQVISIIAVVEKPSVAILPHRVKPKFEGPMFLDRSFERELKEVPRKLRSLGEELESAKKIKRLKKLLKKEEE